ncbi:MAG TPA: ATP-binding protein [Candidatus Omnitrophota bacterium]|nr:ATP-binding protein [Candidatus Omnitrophota bacterium]HPD84730.1 ATP-binding protein [Candidatus Omnitrophota bacterium]HRZ03588.1 ATP-binding protein [Candidatus Omnitrophota bacterium]
MKTIKKKSPKLKQKPLISKKSGISLKLSGQKKKSLPKNSIRNQKRRQLKRRASDQDKTRNHLGEVIRQQADELKFKNGQIRSWEDKDRLAEEQVHIRTKAMDSTADGIFIIDAQKPNFPVIYTNQSFQKMTGYTKREILGRDYFDLYGTDADPRIVREIKHTMLQGKSFHGEMLSFQKNGKKYWDLLRIAPVRDPSGTVTHYVGIQADVTLIRERDLEIKEQREELLHVTRVGKLAEFVSSLAHEISQPLTAILSYAQAAQRILAGREPQLQEILQYIINDDQRASEVIRRLRSLLKKSKPTLESFDINVLINETAMLMATDVTVRNKVLKTELDTNLPAIRGDRIQLQQVLLNLISNSLDAMEGRDDSRELVISTSRKGPNMILVEVKDSGCGIPAENMKKLFSHFFTSKPDGLGMGLSISRSIVEEHGGRLEAKNNPDRGATFYFTISVDKKDVS